MSSIQFRVLALLSILVLAITASCSITYSTVTGIFLQDDNSTNATTFDYTASNFGLINRTYSTGIANCPNLTQWQNFEIYLKHLQKEAPKNTTYKLLFMGRHGEGYHNAAETYYGTPAWNCYWSLLNGNSTTTWADAHLTAKGIAQAQIASNFWRHEIDVQKIMTPQSYYTSPLYRCLSTANVTFSTLGLTGRSKFIPTVKELLREGISEHTCGMVFASMVDPVVWTVANHTWPTPDRRSNKTYIHDSFPTYKIEANFTEYDELWTGTTAETNAGQDIRSKTVLDDIFSTDKATWISITSHSGEIASILRVLGHRSFSLNTGAVIPVLVKAVNGTAGAVPTATTTAALKTPSPHCTVPPVSSISNGACVCPNSAAPVTSLLVTALPQSSR